jgi:hypothetical protein
MQWERSISPTRRGEALRRHSSRRSELVPGIASCVRVGGVQPGDGRGRCPLSSLLLAQGFALLTGIRSATGDLSPPMPQARRAFALGQGGSLCA